jgi:hypothetical protein
MRWVAYVGHTGDVRNARHEMFTNSKGRDHFEDTGVNGIFMVM